MNKNHKHRITLVIFPMLVAMLALMVSACNLSSAPEATEEITPESTFGGIPSRTPQGTGAPTTLPLTSLALTALPIQSGRPTSVIVAPTAVLPPQVVQPNPSTPVSIVILSPVPGNVVAGNVQVLGSATHPQFLQYQLEFGPDPNPGNLWYPATTAVQTPILNNLLGIWNTTAVQDGTYQLRLRVFLRDATSLATVVNNIRIQNRAPTPQPSNTPTTPRPVAAFTQDRASGQAPLAVKFTNLSTGNINKIEWNFGDGSTSDRTNPSHTYNTPGLYNVTLKVTGPGGSSNVTAQITVQSANPPSAGFTSDKTSGPSPLIVQFTDQSVGQVTSYSWNFSDGTSSTEKNPSHTFTVAGTYNVFLTVSGPGGSSSTRREIIVTGPTVTPPPTFTPTAALTPTATGIPIPKPIASFSAAVMGNLVIQFTNQSTGDGINAWAWDFDNNGSIDSVDQHPAHTYPAPGVYQVKLVVTGIGGQSDPFITTVNVPAPVVPPVASFNAAPAGDLMIQFADLSTGDGISAWAWDFDSNGSVDSGAQNPVYTYPAPGTYNVTLTVTGTGGMSAPYTMSVNVAPVGPPPFDPGIVGSTAIISSLDSDLGDIADNGVNNQARRPRVFTIVGDAAALDAFAGSGYWLDDSSSYLQGVIDWYKVVDFGGANSFNRGSLALNSGWKVADLHNPSVTSIDCNSDATPLLAEIRASNATVIIISIGANDAADVNPANLNADGFRNNLALVVSAAKHCGVIPVLLTAPPRLDGAVTQEQTRAINQAIIQVADNEDVPLYNQWRALTELPNSGLSGGVSLTVSPGGAGDLSSSATSNYGLNRRNRDLLDILNNIVSTFFSDSTP